MSCFIQQSISNPKDFTFTKVSVKKTSKDLPLRTHCNENSFLFIFFFLLLKNSSFNCRKQNNVNTQSSSAQILGTSSKMTPDKTSPEKTYLLVVKIIECKHVLHGRHKKKVVLLDVDVHNRVICIFLKLKNTLVLSKCSWYAESFKKMFLCFGKMLVSLKL